MHNAEFLKPRLIGARFEQHAIPLDMLRDLSALEDLITDVAKWHFLKRNPERKRLRRGFTKGLALKLTSIEEGSAIPVISLVVASKLLFPTEVEECFEAARESIVRAIGAAASGDDVGRYIPERVLGHFEKIGRGLLDGEAIEFASGDCIAPVVLTKETRRTLLLAGHGVCSVQETVTLYGLIPEADQKDMTFHIELPDGRKIKAPLLASYNDTVMEAFNCYKQSARVCLQGIGIFSRSNRLEHVDSVDQLVLIDELDVYARLTELAALKDGWLDGEGKALDPSELRWLEDWFSSFIQDDLPLPHLYPTIDGKVRAEWTLGQNEISLEFNVGTKEAFWHSLDLSTDESEERTVALEDEDQIRELIGTIQKFSEGQ